MGDVLKYNAETIDEDKLPTFSQLYGMAPNATGGLPAEDFIAKVRAGTTDMPAEPVVPLSEVLELLSGYESKFEGKINDLPKGHLSMGAGIHRTRAAFCRELTKQLKQKYGVSE